MQDFNGPEEPLKTSFIMRRKHFHLLYSPYHSNILSTDDELSDICTKEEIEEIVNASSKNELKFEAPESMNELLSKYLYF